MPKHVMKAFITVLRLPKVMVLQKLKDPKTLKTSTARAKPSGVR